ncbi:hypothetical protein IJK16_02165 [Candidatus Saccharibacteria bacterium]|nr:hypothetical protein [Candidatus Saccharibacteria bacterium]
MEQNTNTGIPVAPVVENKQKGGNGLKIATVVACVMAVCGIGFGVYGMMRGSDKDNQISELKTQVNNLNNKISVSENGNTNNGSTINGSGDDSTTAVNNSSEDYIFVGVWNFKIKKPENWRDLVQKYVYYNDYPQAVDTFEIIENESVATSHAMISPGNGNCKDDEWTDCIEVKLGNGSTLDVRVPKTDSGSVSKNFRNWITNSDNYSQI